MPTASAAAAPLRASFESHVFISLFLAPDSMRLLLDPLRRRPELAAPRPERHAEEKREVDQRANLRDQRRSRRRRPCPDERERHEYQYKYRVENLVKKRPVPNRLHGAAIEPRQETQ